MRPSTTPTLTAAIAHDSGRGEEEWCPGGVGDRTNQDFAWLRHTEDPRCCMDRDPSHLVALKLNSGTDLQKYTPNLRISNAGNGRKQRGHQNDDSSDHCCSPKLEKYSMKYLSAGTVQRFLN
jgi:hypothetical protein